MTRPSSSPDPVDTDVEASAARMNADVHDEGEEHPGDAAEVFTNSDHAASGTSETSRPVQGVRQPR